MEYILCIIYSIYYILYIIICYGYVLNASLLSGMFQLFEPLRSGGGTLHVPREGQERGWLQHSRRSVFRLPLSVLLNMLNVTKLPSQNVPAAF